MQRNRIGIALALGIALATAGCGSSTSPSTPEGAYASFKAAFDAKDWDNVYARLTEDSLNGLGGMMIRVTKREVDMSGDGARQESFYAVLTEHGLNPDDVTFELVMDPAVIKESAFAIMEPVENKSALVADVVRWLIANNPDEADRYAEMTTGELTKVTVNEAGDVATCTVSQTDDEATAETQIEMHKVNGEWFIHMPM